MTLVGSLLFGLVISVAAAADSPPASKTKASGCCSKPAGTSAKLVSRPTADSLGTDVLISLEDSVEPLRKRFNAEADKPRVVAILSPT